MIRTVIMFFVLSFNTAIATTYQMLIPFPPGGGVDYTFKHFQKFASDNGMNVVPMSKPGAQSLIAMKDLDSSDEAKKGIRISLTTAQSYISAMTMQPTLNIKPLSAIKMPSGCIVVPVNSKLNTLQELIQELKINDNLVIATGAPAQTLSLNRFFAEENIPKRQLIQYKGSGEILTQVAGGHVDVAWMPLTLADNFRKNKQLKIVAIASKIDYESYSTIPNLGKRYPHWNQDEAFIFVINKDIDPIMLDKWQKLVKSYIELSSNKDHFKTEFMEPAPFGEKFIDNFIKRAQESINKFVN